MNTIIEICAAVCVVMLTILIIAFVLWLIKETFSD